MIAEPKVDLIWDEKSKTFVLPIPDTKQIITPYNGGVLPRIAKGSIQVAKGTGLIVGYAVLIVGTVAIEATAFVLVAIGKVMQGIWIASRKPKVYDIDDDYEYGHQSIRSSNNITVTVKIEQR